MTGGRKGLCTAGVAVAALLAAMSGTAAQPFSCSSITVQNCPSLFEDECRDETFRTANVEACFDAVTGFSSDEPFCTDAFVAACRPSDACASLDDPVKRHFCTADQPACKTSIPGLLDDYNVVLRKLELSLEKYEDLTSLDLGEATSIDILCNYEIEQLKRLRSSAETELSTLEESENSIQQIDQCASTMQSFLDAGAPRELPQELWDQIANVLINGMLQIQGKQGQIQSKIGSLHAAPAKLQSLQVAYGLVCAAPTTGAGTTLR